jgi:hypothetical protein
MGATLRRRCGFGSTFGSTSVSFSAPLPGARVTSLGLAKEKSPRERPPRYCVFRPSMDEKSVRSGRACRRAVPGAAASGRNPLRPPCGPDRPALTAAQGPRKSFASLTAILASFEARFSGLPCTSMRAGSAPNGAPRTRRAGDGKVRRMARRMRASSPQAQGCAFGEPRRPHAHPEHRDVLRTGSRGGLLFGDFLLAMHVKVTRSPGRGAEQDMEVAGVESTTIKTARFSESGASTARRTAQSAARRPW